MPRHPAACLLKVLRRRAGGRGVASLQKELTPVDAGDGQDAERLRAVRTDDDCRVIYVASRLPSAV